MTGRPEEIARRPPGSPFVAPLLPSRTLCALVLMLCLLVVARTVRVLPHHTGVTHVAGAWIALADDLRHGTFYRPLISDLGYGGTRYAPLQFVLHAGLMGITREPVWSGYLLTMLSLAALYGAALHWLIRLGAGLKMAAVTAALILALGPVQMALTTIRGDLLAAALNLWGLALCPWGGQGGPAFSGTGMAPGARCTPRLFWPALLFSLAALTKITTVFGVAAASLDLWLRRDQRRAAYRLLVLTALGVTVGLCLTVWASHGRFWESIRTCASGSPSLGGIKHLILRASQNDPIGVLLWALAIAGTWALPRPARPRLPTLAFACTGLVTVVIFLSPGADWNHLLDIDVCALLLLASVLLRGTIPPSFGMSLLVVPALFAVARTSVVGTASNARADQLAHTETVRAIRELGSRGPVLVENAGLAVEAGVRPYLLDPFTLRLARQRRADIDQDFLGKLDSGFFSAIVLLRDPAAGAATVEWYENEHLGPGFLEGLDRHYRLDHRFPRSRVYVPK